MANEQTTVFVLTECCFSVEGDDFHTPVAVTDKPEQAKAWRQYEEYILNDPEFFSSKYYQGVVEEKALQEEEVAWSELPTKVYLLLDPDLTTGDICGVTRFYSRALHWGSFLEFTLDDPGSKFFQECAKREAEEAI